MKHHKKAIFQVLLLVVAIFAFAYLIEEVSAASGGDTTGGKSQGASTIGLFAGKVGGLVGTLAYAAVIYTVITWIGGMVSDDSSKVEAIANGITAAYVAGSLFNYAVGGTWSGAASALMSGVFAAMAFFVVLIIIAVIVYYLTYTEITITKVEYDCSLWSPESGGNNCEECNNGIIPCSTYQCKSLGKSCQIINERTPDETQCVWVNRNDVSPPIISTNSSFLLPGHEYREDITIALPERGVEIINNMSADNCVAAFTPISFGITTNEPSSCKIDYLRKTDFEEMDYYFGGSATFKTTHQQVMSLPSPESFKSENITVKNDGRFEIFTRCEDFNGNSNVETFVFKYCVQRGPDTTPPQIVSMNVLNGMPISYGTTNLSFQANLNEPSECRWSYWDKDYNEMENQMECSTRIMEMNAQMLYGCSTTISGLKDEVENEFFIRCKDKPFAEEKDQNVNSESYRVVLQGTRPLVILSAEPNKVTVKDSTDVVEVKIEVETGEGYNDGEAYCLYSTNEERQGSYIAFANSASHLHTQPLNLEPGEYTYFIKCVDQGGNTAKEKIIFKVEADKEPPKVVRAYRSENKLKIVTDEKAKCVYDVVDCNYPFEEANSMSIAYSETHELPWDKTKTYYIKCEDLFGNKNYGCATQIKPEEL